MRTGATQTFYLRVMTKIRGTTAPPHSPIAIPTNSTSPAATPLDGARRDPHPTGDPIGASLPPHAAGQGLIDLPRDRAPPTPAASGSRRGGGSDACCPLDPGAAALRAPPSCVAVDLRAPQPRELLCLEFGERERERVKCVYERMDDASGDAAGSGRRTRTRGAEAVARSAALDRIRAIREGRTRAADAVHVKVDAPIYDTVAEEDFVALVIRRRKEAGEFIIDDDGLGYAEDGREEDWTHRALPSSSDEGSDGEDGARRKRKQPRPPQPKRPPQQSAAAASLSAAAAMMGKQRISSMFTSTVFKKPGNDRAKGSALAADSIVDDVIAEFAPDENDREERRRRVGRVCAPQHPPPTVFYFNSENVDLDAETVVRSDSGFETDGCSDHANDMTVELKSDAEINTKLEENPGSSAELVVEDKSSEELKQEANGEAKIEKGAPSQCKD
ncbi:hypothetical protein HU200_058147 [Digitaria exilis]|uniref:DNA polymerase alpha catalytic subunit N-terminal domain-containing protein n=1 Tax=Digitaria exilis TaxID=1010633 RepID=A0A835AA49_9POAL|nr:hypothetical protein HU200_058147 [Digitaria exilis]